MNKIAAVYANSLFEIALEEKLDKNILLEITQVNEIIINTPEFIKVLDAPMIAREEKLQLIDKIFKGQVNDYIVNFIKVMVDRKAAAYLQESFLAYEQQYNKHYNIEKVVATTAVPMSQELQDGLKAKLEKTTGKTIVLENKLDKDTIGGVVIKFSDTQIDSSIAQKLRGIKEELAKV